MYNYPKLALCSFKLRKNVAIKYTGPFLKYLKDMCSYSLILSKFKLLARKLITVFDYCRAHISTPVADILLFSQFYECLSIFKKKEKFPLPRKNISKAAWKVPGKLTPEDSIFPHGKQNSFPPNDGYAVVQMAISRIDV